MGRHKLYYEDPKEVRDTLNEAIELATKILSDEKVLIEKLALIDQRRFYVRYGFKTLTGFCENALKLTKTQTQRIVTRVRRCDPMAPIVDRRSRDLLSGNSLTKSSDFIE